jgi:multiple sugar transport system substrate-binding protein
MPIWTRRNLLRGTAASGLALASPRIARAADAVKVIYWHHFTSQEEFAGLKRVMEMFKQRYPGIDLQQENIPNPDYMAKFTAAVVANTRPDVTMIAAERLADMLGMNGLVDLTARIDAWPNKKNYPASTWTGCSDKGKIYGLPAFTFIDWVYWRKDWFEQAGIAGPPKNLDEFVTTAKKLTDAHRRPDGGVRHQVRGGRQERAGEAESYGRGEVVLRPCHGS